MANTTHFKNLIMGNTFGTDTSTPIPSAYYIGLSSTAPTAAGGNVTEPSSVGTGYARVQLTSLSAPVSGVISNTAAIQFPESLADWFPAGSPATHYVIYDGATSGNLLMFNELTTARIIEINTIATIKASSLYLQLTD